MRTLWFWSVFWLLLLLPVVLVALGRRATALRTAGADGEHPRDGIHFARGLAAASGIVPLALLLLGLLPRASYNDALNTISLYVPILGTLVGLCALVLYLWKGRGMERWIGSLAAVLALGWLVLLVMAGWAAA
jgi:hypothetical protein